MKRLLFILLFINNLQLFAAPLVIGALVSAPPFSSATYIDKKPYFFGFSIDIMNNICSKINRTCIYQPVTLESQLAALDKHEIDLLLLAYPYDSKDLKNYAVSVPYLLSKIRFIARDNNPISSIDAIKNKKIGAYKGTFYPLLQNSHFNGNNSITPYSDVNDLINDLVAGKVDLIVLNNAIASNYINNDAYGIKSVGEEIEIGAGYGIIGLQKESALITEINHVIESLLKDGSYLAIYKKYVD